jgi:hypothetical protein
MTILILGNSSHLCEAIRWAYPSHEIKVIPWRELADEAHELHADLVFIVGFDYGSYFKRYESYIDANVHQPMLALQRFAKPTADVVYVTTQSGRRGFTFSRYRYAKEMLGHQLVLQWPHSHILRFDTFATSAHEPMVKGGAMTRWVFHCLAKMGVIKTVDMLTVRDRLKAYSSCATHDSSATKGILLAIPRPQLIDRLMRLLIG